MGYKDPTSNLWMLPIGQDKMWTTPASNSEDPRMHKILLSHHIEHNNAQWLRSFHNKLVVMPHLPGRNIIREQCMVAVAVK